MIRNNWSSINDHPPLKIHIGSHTKLLLGPSKHPLNILIIDKPRKAPLVLALLQQPGGVVHQHHQVAQLELSLLVLLLDGDIVFAVLQEEVEFDVLEGGPVDEAADVVLELVDVLPLVLVAHLPQLPRLGLPVLPLEHHLVLVQLAVQLLQHQDQPPRQVLDLVLPLFGGDHQLHAAEEAPAVVEQVDCGFEVDCSGEDDVLFLGFFGVDGF